MFMHQKVVDHWKNGNWNQLLDWYGDFDLSSVNDVSGLLSPDVDEKIQ